MDSWDVGPNMTVVYIIANIIPRKLAFVVRLGNMKISNMMQYTVCLMSVTYYCISVMHYLVAALAKICQSYRAGFNIFIFFSFIHAFRLPLHGLHGLLGLDELLLLFLCCLNILPLHMFHSLFNQSFLPFIHQFFHC